jgi:hypothetical protein
MEKYRNPLVAEEESKCTLCVLLLWKYFTFVWLFYIPVLFEYNTSLIVV